MSEDRLLIWKFNRGRTDVLQRIYVKYKDDLMTLAAALLRDRSSAEDVVHDVFVAFIGSCGTLRLKDNLKGYLTTCVANNVRNRIKARQKRTGTSLEQAEAIASQSDGPDSSAMFDEQSQRLTWALSQLPEPQQAVLLLHLYSGMKFRAIAESEGESINTIQGRYRYGLAKLRALLEGEVEK